jgi:DeoR/GlpR family transcriptional regulator of sugar metabolism
MSNGRHELMIELLQVHHMLTIPELSEKLHVSQATVRRDLELLESSGRIKRVPGGALSLQGLYASGDDQLSSERDPYLPYKQAIADAAVALVKPGDTIFIDSGSTNNEIAKRLAALSDISVVTNSVEIAHFFIRRKDIATFICGGTMGEVEPYSSIVGPLAEKMILQFRANIAFIGTSGVHEKQGLTCSYLSVARIKQAMIENSAHTVLVTDHSKFGKVCKAFFCPLNEIDRIITDQQVSLRDLECLKENGVDVIQAG